MDKTDILNNRVYQFSVNVPDDFDFNKHKNILISSVQNSLKYLYDMLFDNFYLRDFIYEVSEYYPISNIVIVKRINNFTDNNCFKINIKEKYS